jgi:2'-5' RNA ligase
VRKLRFYRYFLGCRPEPHLHPAFRRIGTDAGQQVRLDMLHFTLCVIAELPERDRSLLRRVQGALADRQLQSFPLRLSRVVGSPHRAEARTFGPQNEVQDFYLRLVQMLLEVGIEPLHRKSGLHPHVTLGHAPCPFRLRRVAIEWFPSKLLLIESEVGLSRHNALGSWPLPPPRQPLLSLGAPRGAALGQLACSTARRPAGGGLSSSRDDMPVSSPRS